MGQTKAITLSHVYPKTPEGRARRIDYRHIIHALAAKPQAFCFSRMRDDLLPTSQYRELWQRAEQQFDLRHDMQQPIIPPRQHGVDTCDQLLNGDRMTQETAYV
ncbi:MAG: hypothetical protein H6936_13710 [Burkholderiales bacterium]|nr:hypothetical protein [Burkholderiales bacterium]